MQALPDLIKYTTNAQNLDFYGGAMPTWVIHGVSLADFNPNSTPAAPVFLNDAYQPSTVMGTGSLFDIARVEVLKGPRSGLYGRNTIGGAVRVLTNKPNFGRASGSIGVSYGRWGDGHVNAAYDAPITRNMAFCIAETSDQGWSGWQTSLQNGGVQFSAVGDLGDLGGLELTSITSLDYFDYGLNYNDAATGPVYATQVEHTPMRMAQENLRLGSGKPKRLDWLLGLDVAYEDLEENKQFQLFDDALETLYTGLSGAANEGILSYTQKTQSYSGYGQLTYHILPKLLLDFGARSTWEYKTYHGAFQQSPGYYMASNVTRQYQLKDHVTGKAVLRYQFDPLNMVYASVARGYKSGGFYGGFPIASTAQIDPYREEQVWAVEAGFKAQTKDRKLIVDGAAFYYRTYNYQNFTTEYSAVSKTITSTLTNLGTAVNQGLEGNIVWKPVPTLTLNLGAAYNDAKIVKSSQYQLDYAGNLVAWQGQPRLPRKRPSARKPMTRSRPSSYSIWS
ncbi:TonB-dependent receptor [Asaia krungthepensis NRIC 0535]|uniref:TonB-dependent receptor n=1 Tax=Asaia krungthepensis NRIC 0535 TaxID=1307925 RepID=A0ABQ0PVC8_9PROT|nr:TonB-dependent receptor [Asaia krungthepensis NRIC 0535]